MVHISLFHFSVMRTSKLAALILLRYAVSEVYDVPQCEQQDSDIFSLIQSNREWRNPDASRSAPLASAVSMPQNETGKATPPMQAAVVVKAGGRRNALAQLVRNIARSAHHAEGAHWGWIIPCLIFLIATCAFVAGSVANKVDHSQDKASAHLLSNTPEFGSGIKASQASAEASRSSPAQVVRSPEPLSPLATAPPRPSIETGSIVPMPELQLPTTGSQWPQPLVKSLVLPTSESRLGVDIYALAKAATDSTVNVLSTSGKPLLCVTIRSGGASYADANKLEICLVQRSYEPKCTIVTPPRDNPGAPFKILDARGDVYGEFHSIAPGVNQVTVQNMDHFVVEGDPAQLKFSVTHRTGKPVALARLNNEDFPGGEHLEIRVLPGVDAVLVVAVVLAISIFSTYDPEF